MIKILLFTLATDLTLSSLFIRNKIIFNLILFIVRILLRIFYILKIEKEFIGFFIYNTLILFSALQQECMKMRIEVKKADRVPEEIQSLLKLLSVPR